MANDRPNFPKGAPPGGDAMYDVPRVRVPAPEPNASDDAARRAGAPAGKWSEGIEKPVPITPAQPATYNPPVSK
jgi:hypothetical protein